MFSETRKNFIIRPEINASLWYAVSSAVSRAFAVLATPVFTRLLSPEEYATYPLYVSYMGIFTVLATFEIPGAITYGGLAKFKNDGADGFLLSAFISEALLSLSFLILYLFSRGAVNSFTGMGTALSLVLILQVFLNSAEGLYLSKKRFLNSYKWVTLVNTVTGVLTPLLSITLIRLGLSRGARIISQLSVSIFLACYVLYKLVAGGRGRVRGEHFKYIFGLALPMLPHYLALSVTAGVDKIMIANLLGRAALGKYSVAFSLGFTVSILGNAMQMALSPWIAKRTRESDLCNLLFALGGAQTLLCVLTMMFLCLAPEFFKLLADASYHDAVSVMYPVAISTVFSFSSALCVGAATRLGKAGKITSITLLSAVLSVALSYILVNALGYIGGALSTLFVSVFRFLGNLALLCKKGDVDFENVKIYLRNILLVFAFGCLLFALKGVYVSRILIFSALIMVLLATLLKYKDILLGKRDKCRNL